MLTMTMMKKVLTITTPDTDYVDSDGNGNADNIDEEGADNDVTCADVCPHVHLQPPQLGQPGLQYHENYLQYFIL